jgi:hypothetical protein
VDVWGIGLRPGGRCQYQTLTQHWDGSAWTVIPSPSHTAVNSVLDGVTVAGAQQAWAVGTMGCPADQARTLTEHWNGTRWSIAPVPHVAVGVLESVSVTSASDVWAVGAGQQSGQSTVVPHFDGSSWKSVTVPAPPGSSGGLFGVRALSATDAWAVGEPFPIAGGNGKILTDHWNGTSWQVVTATPVGGPSALSALSWVDAAPGTGVWAVGGKVGRIKMRSPACAIWPVLYRSQHPSAECDRRQNGGLVSVLAGCGRHSAP